MGRSPGSRLEEAAVLTDSSDHLPAHLRCTVTDPHLLLLS